MSAPLYELVGQFKDLSDGIEGMSDEELKDTLEGLKGEIEDKAEAVLMVRVNINADISVLDAEIERLAQRKLKIEKKEKGLRDYLKTNMVAANIKNFKFPLGSVSTILGRDLVEIIMQDNIPDEYMNVTTVEKPDKKKILEDLQAGKTIAGVKLGKSATGLRIT